MVIPWTRNGANKLRVKINVEKNAATRKLKEKSLETETTVWKLAGSGSLLALATNRMVVERVSTFSW